MFTSSPGHYERNIKDAASAKAGKARIDAPDGNHLQGVVVWSGKAVRLVMPTAEALRLANEIADSIAAHKKVN